MNRQNILLFSVFVSLSILCFIGFNLVSKDCLRWVVLEGPTASNSFEYASSGYNTLVRYDRTILNYSQPIQPPVQCVPIQTIKGKIPICVHDNPNEYITQEIRRTQNWEAPTSASIQKILLANPDSAIVDIGANLGMYGLLGANLQRPVLSVEAMDININKYHQSIVINHFEKLITVVTRPLSDKYETLQLTAGVSNLGMSRLVNAGQSMNGLDAKKYNARNKTTVILDDLIEFMRWKKAIMVIDVEGNEGKVMRGAGKFFDAINVTHIYMEGNLLIEKDRTFINNFLSKRGYKPHATPSFINQIVLKNNVGWPANVYWKR